MVARSGTSVATDRCRHRTSFREEAREGAMPGDIVQSVLNPAGAQALSIHRLWSLMFWVSATVFATVLTLILIAVARGVRRDSADESAGPSQQALSRGVVAGVAATVAILIGLLGVSVWTGRTVASLRAWSAVTIDVVGHQWWWEIEYEDGIPSRRVRTANEIHVPVGQPVVFKLTSRDVIHSFWIPNLQGKRDLIPGYTTAIWLQADRAGVFRGQCAEFCGLQHAHMALDVVAESAADFERWLDGMRQAAREPQTDSEVRGRELFMTARCASCHTINGTEAHGQVAPDLTHVASRRTLGAGTLPNSRQQLAQWVRDPQHSKPGNQMPPNPLPSDDIDILLAYLDTLR
jgi:cytochrome c oxidase subunit 2